MEKINTIFEAAEGATFDSLTIGYKVNRYNETDKSGSTMVVRGFNVTGELNINCADGKLIVEDNTAQTIKITMNRQDGKENADIQTVEHNGQTLTIIKKESERQLLGIIPGTDFQYLIVGDLSDEEIIDIANSIQIKKEE